MSFHIDPNKVEAWGKTNIRWRKKGRFYEAIWLNGKKPICQIGQMENCGYWYIWFLMDDNKYDEPEGFRYHRKYEAVYHVVCKLYLGRKKKK